MVNCQWSMAMVSGQVMLPLRDRCLLTVGHTLDEAAWWFITMARSCQAQLMAEAAGKPVLIDPDTASLT